MGLSKLRQALDTKEIYIIRNNNAKFFKDISTKQIYQTLISKLSSPPTAIDKWVEIFPFMETIEWDKIFQLPYVITRESFLQTFQYKILNRIINCNHKLHIWGIRDNNKCEYCEHIDTLEHHFFWCKRTQEFWNQIRTWASDNLDTSMKLTICEVIFGINIQGNKSIDTINFLILIGKRFINKSRTDKQPLYFLNFLALIKEKIHLTTYNRLINNQPIKDWEMELMDIL